MGARATQGQCLCRARDCPRWHTRTHTDMHTHLPKTEAYCGRPGQIGPRTTVTHCITLCFSISFFFLSFSLIITNYYLCPFFFLSVTSHQTIFNFFTSVSDVIMTSHSYLTLTELTLHKLTSLSFASLVPFMKDVSIFLSFHHPFLMTHSFSPHVE